MADQTTNRPADRVGVVERTGWRAADAPGVVAPASAVVAPLDRVRWSSILAGLFTVLATLIVMTVLGVAIGLSTFDANNPRNFGIGAGIYGAISALVAFFLGGFAAARTAAVAGSGNALLNGAMVWVVTIPFIVNILGTGIGTLLGTATDVATSAAGAAAQVAAPIVGKAAEQVATTPAAQATVAAGAEGAVDAAQETAQDIQQQVQAIDAQDVENAARDLSGPAWAALLALGLSAGAAALGGLAGRRTMPTEVAVSEV
jgi:hypothetical protein